eukprot:scaffold47775_cov57-Phaeocystis_antarctica.AAC.2
MRNARADVAGHCGISVSKTVADLATVPSHTTTAYASVPVTRSACLMWAAAISSSFTSASPPAACRHGASAAVGVSSGGGWLLSFTDVKSIRSRGGAQPVLGQPFVCDRHRGGSVVCVCPSYVCSRAVGQHVTSASSARLHRAGRDGRAGGDLRGEPHRMVPQVFRRRAIIAKVGYDPS